MTHHQLQLTGESRANTAQDYTDAQPLFWSQHMNDRVNQAARMASVYRNLISLAESQLTSVNRFLSGDTWFESMVRETQFLTDELEDLRMQLQNIIDGKESCTE